MECHKCPDYMKHQNEPWETTPCAACQLKEDSYGTLEYQEGHIANSSVDNPDDEDWSQEQADPQAQQPYSLLDCEDPADPSLPLSTLVSAMGLFLSLSLPARRTIQLRMNNIPYSEIGRRLGCTRQGVEKLLAQAIAKQPLLGNLLPAKSARGSTALTATHTLAMAGNDKSGKQGVTASRNAVFDSKKTVRDSA